jgi:hypothetical protein
MTLQKRLVQLSQEERAMPWDFIDAALNLASAIINLRASSKKATEAELREFLANLEKEVRRNEEARRKGEQLVLAATLFTLTAGTVGAGIIFKWATRKKSG